MCEGLKNSNNLSQCREFNIGVMCNGNVYCVLCNVECVVCGVIEISLREGKRAGVLL